MQPDYFSPSVHLSTKPSMSKLGADILFIPIFEDHNVASLQRLLSGDEARELRRVRASGEFKCKNFESLVLPIKKPSGKKAKRIAFLGAGKKKSMSVDLWRRLMSTAVIISRKACYAKVAFLCDGADDRIVQALVEGAYLGNFNSGSYKTKETGFGWVKSIELVVTGGHDLKALRAGVRRGSVFGEYTNVARGLVNEPSNILTPRTLASRAAKLGRACPGLKVKVLDF